MVPNKIFDGMLNKFNFKKFERVYKVTYIISTIFIILQFVYFIAILINPYKLLPTIKFNPFIVSIFIFIPFFAYLTYRSSKTLTSEGKFTYLKYSFSLLDLTLFFSLTTLSFTYFYKLCTFTGIDITQIEINTLRNVLIPFSIILPFAFCIPLMNTFITFITSTDVQKGVKNDFKVRVYAPSKKESNLSFYTRICKNKDTNKPVYVGEKKRMEGTLIQGATGTGKTSTVLLPMCAMDLEKKYMIRELSKELGYKCLQKGIARLKVPISNEALNENFSLKYLEPENGKETEFEQELAEVIRYKDKETKQIFYKDAAIVVLEPDGNFINDVHNVATNFGIKVLKIDPLDPNSVGINPFLGKEPAKIASIISNVLKGMYESEGSSDSNLFFTQVTQQAIENIAILLKIMYPKMNNNEIPTLEDMLTCLHDYNIIENMCEEMKRDPVLAEEYDTLITYFEKNFYNPPLNDMGMPIAGTSIGSGRKATEKFLYGATTQLDNILRQPEVNKLLCDRHNNIDFDNALENGICITACSRRGALSSLLSKAFGMFFILAFQDAVLRRPGNENTRTPFFFYIDEFPDFVNKETETCFTLFRKYRCGMIIAIQNLSQLERTKSMAFYKKVVISNTKTKIVFGGTNLDDSLFWQKEMGHSFQWGWKYGGIKDQTDGSESVSVSAADDLRFFDFEIAGLPFKTIVYKTLNIEDQEDVSTGITDFLEEKYYKEYPIKKFDFTRFIPESTGEYDVNNPIYNYSNIVEPEIIPAKINFDETSITEPNTENIQNDENVKSSKLSNDEIDALSDLMFETAMGNSFEDKDKEKNKLK